MTPPRGRGRGSGRGKAPGAGRSGGPGGAGRGKPSGTGRSGGPGGAGRGKPSGAGRKAPGGAGGLGGDQVEGRQAVRELLLAGRRRVREVLVADATEHDPVVADIVALAEGNGVPVRRASRVRIESVAGTQAPQGVVAFAQPVGETDLDELAAASRPFLLVLDGVTDPHNLGALMRTGVAAGATGVVIARHRSAHLSPAAVKAAAGAVEHLPIATVSGIPAALSSLRAAGVWTVGLDAEGSQSLWGLEVATEGVALVLGAEGAGLSRLVRDRCEVLVRIPMTGPLGSLNVSAAGAVAAFEVAHRRGQNGEFAQR